MSNYIVNILNSFKSHSIPENNSNTHANVYIHKRQQSSLVINLETSDIPDANSNPTES